VSNDQCVLLIPAGDFNLRNAGTTVQCFYQACQFWQCVRDILTQDMAFVHVCHVTAVPFPKADEHPLFGGNVANRKPCFTTIIPFWATQWRIDRSRFKVAGVFQELQQNAFFSHHLCIHGQMLKTAGAAIAKMRATRPDPVRHWLQYFQGFGLATLTPAKQVTRNDFFTWQRIIHFQGFLLVFGQAHALGIKCNDVQLKRQIRQFFAAAPHYLISTIISLTALSRPSNKARATME